MDNILALFDDQPTPNLDQDWIMQFCVGNMYMGPAPAERHLIKDFLVHRATTAFVADGGVGKTYIMIDLALRAACGPYINGQPNYFMGFHIQEHCNVVLFTMEDRKDDIHRRICAIDPDETLRKNCDGHLSIIPVQEYFSDGLVLAERDKNGNYKASKKWEYLCQTLQQCLEEGKMDNMPLIVIIDTYSATHHGDENGAIGTNEWFRAANLLTKLNATLVVTHHIRKTDPRQEIRTPSDMRAAVRGSTAFTNNVRVCYGLWEMPNANAVIKELNTQERVRLLNMGILKNNTGINWDERSDPRYPEPMITLRRGNKGQLIFDEEVHGKRLELAGDKEKRLEEMRVQLRAAIIFACRWYAEHQWPLNKSNLTREKEQYLPSPVNELGYKNVIEPVITELLSEGWIKQIKIKGNKHIFDVANGPYSGGLRAERVSVTPTLPWNECEYDAENNQFILRSNS